MCIVGHKHALPHRSSSADDMCSGWVSLLKSHLAHALKAAAGRASPHDAHFSETTGTVTSRFFFCGHLLWHCLQLQDRPSREWLIRMNRAAGSVSWQLQHFFSSGIVTSLVPKDRDRSAWHAKHNPFLPPSRRGSTWKHAAGSCSWQPLQCPGSCMLGVFQPAVRGHAHACSVSSNLQSEARGSGFEAVTMQSSSCQSAITVQRDVSMPQNMHTCPEQQHARRRTGGAA